MAADVAGSEVGVNDGFEEPTLVEIGSVHELTLQDKAFNASDGITVGGIPVGISSV